jgi:hypothetical protein
MKEGPPGRPAPFFQPGPATGLQRLKTPSSCRKYYPRHLALSSVECQYVQGAKCGAMIHWIKALPTRIWHGLLYVWRGICWLGRTVKSPGGFLESHQGGLQNCGLTLSGIAGGGFFAILISTQPTWPWHVVLLLFGSVALAVAFFMGAAVGARRGVRQATNNEVLAAVNALDAKIDNLGVSSFVGPAYASASVGPTGPAGTAGPANVAVESLTATIDITTSFQGTLTVKPPQRGPTGPTGPTGPSGSWDGRSGITRHSGGSGPGARSTGPTGPTGPRG